MVRPSMLSLYHLDFFTGWLDIAEDSFLTMAMNSIIDLSSSQLRQAASLKDQIASFQKQLSQVLGSALTGAPAGAAPKRKMSAAGRAKIAAAARARWAKVKGAKAPATAEHKPKGKMSASAKAKLSAKMKAVWAARKATQKK